MGWRRSNDQSRYRPHRQVLGEPRATLVVRCIMTVTTNASPGSGEVLDDVTYSGSEAPENGDCWLTGDSEGGLIEKYLRGDLCIAFHRAESAAGETIQNGFIIRLSKGMLKPWSPLRKVNLSDGRTDLEKALVFSEDIELVDPIENVVSSFVSLCVFDRRSFDGGNPLFAFEHRYGSQKLGPGGSDGELGLAFGFYALAREKGGHEDVQSGPHRIDDHADIHMNARIEGAAEISDQQFLIPILRIRLFVDVVWAAPLPGNESLIHNWDLGIGPSD
jgi:hypothetical protein